MNSFYNILQLYNYLLCHEKAYGFKVLRMEPLFVASAVADFQCDYILSREAECRLTFTNAKTGAQHCDEYDVNIVSSRRRRGRRRMERTSTNAKKRGRRGRAMPSDCGILSF